jgi:hypothetical protein
LTRIDDGDRPVADLAVDGELAVGEAATSRLV